MLIETLDCVTAAPAHEAIFSGSQIGEEEAAVWAGQKCLGIVEGRHRSEGDFGEAERLASESINEDAANTVRGRRRSGLRLQGERPKKCKEESQKAVHERHSSTVVTSRRREAV
jgi:hypothetical protein